MKKMLLMKGVEIIVPNVIRSIKELELQYYEMTLEDKEQYHTS